jgi:hypothetical protein
MPSYTAKPVNGLLYDPLDPLTRGLVAWLPMIEGAGATTRNYATAFPEPMTGGPAWGIGPRGPTLSTDGVVSTVDLTTLPTSFATGITVALWVNMSTVSVRQDILARWGPATQRQFLLLAGLTAGKLAFFISSNGTSTVSANSATTVAAGVWMHVVGTFDNTTIRLYINGVADGTASAAALNVVSTYPAYVGRSNDARAACAVDDVRVYNRPLTPQEVRALYADMTAPFNEYHPDGSASGLGDSIVAGFKAFWASARNLLIGGG